jgi:hypothetical protein
MAQYASLDQIANRYRTLAVSYAPYKTGALKSALDAYNRPSGMIKRTENGVSIRLDVSPPGATYGKFWNDPNISWQVRTAKTKNKDKINFALKAQNSEELDNMINSYILGMIETEVIPDLYEDIDKGMKPMLAIK